MRILLKSSMRYLNIMQQHIKKNLNTTPLISNIPFHCSFIETLARGMLKQCFPLKNWIVFLPSILACQELNNFFKKNYQDITPPTIRLLGSVDYKKLLSIQDNKIQSIINQKPIHPMRRLFFLIQLLLAKQNKDDPFTLQTYHLAKAISYIIDRIYIEESKPNNMQSELSAFHQGMLDFIQIILQAWPNILQENQYIDNEQKHITLLDIEITNLKKNKKPFLIAGSTGSIPSTRRLMQYAQYIILHGLENNKHASQYHMHALLKDLSRPLNSVVDWHILTKIPLITCVEKNRPQNTDNIFWIESHTYIEEANTIVSIIKKYKNNPNHSIMLVTPNTFLIKTVSILLQKENIIPITTYNQSLLETEEGSFFLLIATYMANPNNINQQALNIHPFMPKTWLSESFLPKGTFLEYLNQQKKYCDSLSTLYLTESMQLFLQQSHDNTIILEKDTYVAILQDLLSQHKNNAQQATHPHIKLLTPMESRLQKTQTVILGTLNQDIWDTEEQDPWLGEPLRNALGLESIHSRHCLLEHDIQEILHTKKIILSRTTSDNSTPCRLFLQIMNLFKQKQTQCIMWPTTQFVTKKSLKNLNQASPPLYARPTTLSVSQIELLLKDPYAFYAKHILKLIPTNNYIKIHDFKKIIGIHIHHMFNTLWDAPDEKILPAMQNALVPLFQDSAQKAFALIYINKIAQWFIQIRNTNTDHVTQTQKQQKKSASYKQLTITTQIDRIDITSDKIYIIDYKTGTLPSKKAIYSGEFPKLPIEAFILRKKFTKEIVGYLLHPDKTVHLEEKIIDLAIQSTFKKLDYIIDTYYQKISPFIATGESLDNRYKQLERIT